MQVRTALQKFLAGFLTVMLLLGLTACGRKEETRKINFQSAPAYTAEDIALPVPTGDLIGCCTDGKYMYILADEKTGEEVRSVLCRADLEAGTAAVLEDYRSSDLPEDTVVNRLGPTLAPDGSLWLYEMWVVSTYDLPEDFDETKESKVKYRTSQEEFHHLRQLDPATGREKKLVDLSEAVRNVAEDDSGIWLDVSGFAVDGRGNVCFAKSGGAAVLDQKGDLLFTLEAAVPRADFSGTTGGPLAALPDGTVAVLTTQPGGKREVRTIDASARGWGSGRYELPGGADLIWSGTGGFLFFYMSGGALWGWEPGAEEGRRLLSWADADLPGVVMCAAPLDDRRAAALTLTRTGVFGEDDYWYQAALRLSTLSPADKEPSDGKVRLVYGTIGTNSLQRQRVNLFNKASDRYYIELRNYAGEGVEAWDLDRDMRSAAQKLLNAEVVSGRAPDIWDTTLPTELYARKGLLEDLWPWIDADPEIRREDLMTHVLDCASVDGKLYRVFNSFKIQTAFASAELVGDRTGWTLEEMMDCYRSMPEGGSIFNYYDGKRNTLRYLINNDMDHWIDWDSGECRFDSEEFKTLLEVCGGEGDGHTDEVWQAEWGSERMAGALSGEDLRAGRQLLEMGYLSSPRSLIEYDALAGGPECLMDYEAYLAENDILHGMPDENGDRIDGAFYCRELSQAEYDRRNGKLYSYFPLSEDTVFGAVGGGGYAAYVGYPSSTGNGSFFELPYAYSQFDAVWGISAGCEDKEAAWSFVRQLLLPSAGEEEIESTIYDLQYFPIHKEAFDRCLEPQYFIYEDGTYAVDRDGKPIEDPKSMIVIPSMMDNSNPLQMVVYELAPSETQMERFWTLYNSIDQMSSTDSALLEIILEQAEEYFAGDKSLDETADLIQRRASLYVNENR